MSATYFKDLMRRSNSNRHRIGAFFVYYRTKPNRMYKEPELSVLSSTDYSSQYLFCDSE